MKKRCPDKARILAVKYKYGLDWKEFEALFHQFEGKCAICDKPLSMLAHPEKETAYVDHSHVTGKNRGILCRVCNVGLGHFRDSRLHLQRALKYLDTYDHETDTPNS